MQLSNAPGKIVLPFANAGGKNTIPTASQIGITAGAASLVDGFPPLTRTPIAAGGIPPSGLDMNGILYEISAAIRWATAGAGYLFDSTFSADANVNGYPKGARVLRSDGLGYWLNTADNNTTDPESAGTAAATAGWVPDLTNGVTAVTMTNANVTLTPLQYGKPVISISGTLTTNLNLVFPAIEGQWVVVNNTTGAFSITAKTASGSGVAIPQGGYLPIWCDGTNIYSQVLYGTTAAAGDNSTKHATTAYVMGAQQGHGQCYVSLSGGNVKLSPKNGNKILVNGVQQTIPSGGVSLPPTGLTPNTAYFIYDFINSGTISNRARASNVATITTGAAHGLAVGSVVTVSGVGSGYDAANVAVTAVGSSTTFSYANAGSNESSTPATGAMIGMSLEASTTVHATDTTTGVEIKSGDATRTLVGQAWCTTGPAWIDNQSTIGVLSWFNRVKKRGVGSFSTARSTASTTPVELNTEIRINFLGWAESVPQIDADGGWALTVGGPCYGWIGLDGTTQSNGGSGLNMVANQTTFAAHLGQQQVSEAALHYATLVADVPSGGGTVTFTGGAQAGGQRVELQLVIEG